MEVKSIQGYNQSFEGSVHKSVYRYLDRALKNETEFAIKWANKNNRSVNIEELNSYQRLVKKTKKNLEEFMSKLQKDSILKLDYVSDARGYRTDLYIKNSVVPEKNIHLDKEYGQQQPIEYIEKGAALNILPLSRTSKAKIDGADIIRFKRLSQNLDSFNPQDIDEAFLKMAETQLKEHSTGNFFERIWARLHSYKVGRYAESIQDYRYTYPDLVKRWIFIAKKNQQILTDLKANNKKQVQKFLNS